MGDKELSILGMIMTSDLIEEERWEKLWEKKYEKIKVFQYWKGMK